MAVLPPFPWSARRQPAAWCRTALAREVSLQTAVEAVVQQLASRDVADLALVFASASFASDLPRLMPLLRQKLQAQHWLGCLGSGVVGCGTDGVPHELEQESALSVTLLKLPGAELQPFAIDADNLPDLDGPADPWRALVTGDPAGDGDGDRPRGESQGSLLLLIDPAAPAVNDLLAGLDYAFPNACTIGGIAGQHSAPHGSLLFGDGVRGGAVGCRIGGRWELQAVVAQGCRPIGPVFEVEQAQRNVVMEVSSGEQRNSPVAALQAILTGLTPAEREQVKHSLFLGVGRSDFRLGGGDRNAFLVRNLIGVDPRNGAVAVAERMRVGQKVQFQLRDGDASRSESRQLLSRQAGEEPEPLAALLFACLGRGQGLYGEADGDVRLCREAFSSVPIAGMFCNGEVGPVAGSTHLHGFTASWGFLVPRAAEGSGSAAPFSDV